MKEYYKLAKCSKCNYRGKYIYRNGFGFLEMCEICATSLNKEA